VGIARRRQFRYAQLQPGSLLPSPRLSPPVYGQFTERFDIQDLKEAKAMS
jgi:hypothetical protein